jgi:hypothetical protein
MTDDKKDKKLKTEHKPQVDKGHVISNSTGEYVQAEAEKRSGSK